jgi:DNA-directed RNA polymerase specialized sigma subunit
MHKKTTPEIEALILELHYQGETIAQIAKKTGLNRSVVSRLLFIKCPETRSPSQTALIEKIKAIGVDSSLSLTANAKRHETHILVIQAIFHDLGLPVRKTKKTQLQQQILELRQAGLTYHAIGKQLGISRQRVHQILQRSRRG